MRLEAADLASLLIAGTILIGTLVAPLVEAAGLLPDDSVCLSQQIADTECPGCGMTRSVIALGRGELGRALVINWVAPAMLLIALAHILARAGKALGLTTNLRMFDIATIIGVIAALIVRSIQIWT